MRRALGWLLVVPVLLALGVATVAAFVVAVAAMLFAPLLARRVTTTPEWPPEGDTITLEPDAYRTTSDRPGASAGTNASGRALPPAHSSRS